MPRPVPTSESTSPAVDEHQPERVDLSHLSYEQARDELRDVVQQLEAGGTTLEQSLALWGRGEALAARCQEWLDGARAQLDAAAPGRPNDPPAQ